MKSGKNRGRPKYRLTVKLDLEWDSDLIEWLTALPEGQRSQVVREALRDIVLHRKSLDLAGIREAIAQELSHAMSKFQLQANDLSHSDNAVEEILGEKLDAMLKQFK